MVLIRSNVQLYDERGMPLCEVTMTPRLPERLCVRTACNTYDGNLGPCEAFEQGANERCVYCDHALACHPR